MGEREAAEVPGMEALSVSTAASQPARHGMLTMAEDPTGSGEVQPLSQCRQHLADLGGGGLEPVEGGVPPGADLGAAGLTAEVLDVIGAMMTTTDQRVEGRVGDAVVAAGRVGAGRAGRVDRLGPTAATRGRPPGWDGGRG